MSDTPTTTFLPQRWRGAERAAGSIGLVCLIICAVIWLVFLVTGSRWHEAAEAFYKAYLFAWLFFLGLSLGAVQVVMIHHLVGGEWGYFVRRTGEAAANILPLMLVLMIPILAGMRQIYPWADRHNENPIITHQMSWLNPSFFILRALVYFTLWIAMARRLRALSVRQDRTPDKKLETSLNRISAAGMVIYFVTMSLASVDWVMSLEPGWYSTVFGFIVCMGQGTSAVCVLIILTWLLGSTTSFAPLLRPKHFNDLATLLITAVILWAYTSFAQLLVVWMGNLQQEITWYVQRSFGPWRFISIVLVWLGFLAPFVLLMQRGVKDNGKRLAWVCGGILITQALDVYWWIAPSGIEPYPRLHWLSVVVAIIATAGIGGAWIARVIHLLDRTPLVPGGANVPTGIVGPSVEEQVTHGNEFDTRPGLA